MTNKELHFELRGVIADVEESGFDDVCLETIKRVADALAQREWQGLTDEEIRAMRHMRDWTAGWTDIKYARAIEAKLKEKNA